MVKYTATAAHATDAVDQSSVGVLKAGGFQYCLRRIERPVLYLADFAAVQVELTVETAVKRHDASLYVDHILHAIKVAGKGTCHRADARINAFYLRWLGVAPSQT